jgi:hypothetical protein
MGQKAVEETESLERLKAVVCREDRGLKTDRWQKRVQKAVEETEGRRGDRGL